MILKGIKRLFGATMVAALCGAMLLSGAIVSKADGVEETGASAKSRINQVVKVAQGEIGYTEEADGTTKYGRWYADKVHDSDYATASWSCMFAAWVGHEAGMDEDDYGFYSYTGHWISWFKNNEAYHDGGSYKPSKGDIIFIDNDGNGTVDNTGIIEKRLLNNINVIKGNVNNQVTRVKYNIKDECIIGYGTPKYKEDNQEDGEAVRLIEPKVGIDVSSYNGAIDWDRVKASGVEFAFVRIGYRGYGQAGRFAKDRNFETNMSEANRVGIPAGVYFVTQAITVEEAIEEADWVLEKLGPYQVTYPVVIDTEQASPEERSKDLTRAERTAIIKAFCDRVEEKGYKSQIYSGKFWFKDKLDMEELKGYDIWVAEYTHDQEGETSFAHEYSIWQYTDDGVVDGINGVVDMNNCYVEYEEKSNGGFWDWFR